MKVYDPVPANGFQYLNTVSHLDLLRLNKISDASPLSASWRPIPVKLRTEDSFSRKKLSDSDAPSYFPGSLALS